MIFLLRIRKYIKARLTKHSILISSIISSWRGYNGGKMGSRRYCKCETNSNEWCDITHNVFVKLIHNTLLSFKFFGSINFFSKKKVFINLRKLWYLFWESGNTLTKHSIVRNNSSKDNKHRTLFYLDLTAKVTTKLKIF